MGFLVNTKGGGITALNASGQFFSHPTDDTVDAVAIPFEMESTFDILSITEKLFLTPERMIKHAIGIGDDVFLPGLFTHAAGKKRNMPIVRHGNIAMLPEDQIQVEGKFRDVYLIEARSLPGISGSPVFVRKTISVEGFHEDGTSSQIHGLSGELFFLGLMHGHWDVKESKLNSYEFSHDRQRGVNSGIAVVVPAHKILEIINQPVLQFRRSLAENKFRESGSPGLDLGVE